MLDPLKKDFLEEVSSMELQGFAMLCLHLGVPVSSPVVLFILSALRFQERRAAGTSAILYPQSGPHIIRPAASESNIIFVRVYFQTERQKRQGKSKTGVVDVCLAALTTAAFLIFQPGCPLTPASPPFGL